VRPITSTLCLALSYFAAETLQAAELKQETSKAFNRHIVLTEERMARSLQDGDSFYSMNGKPELQREALRIRLRQGKIIIDQMETLDGGRTIRVPLRALRDGKLSDAAPCLSQYRGNQFELLLTLLPTAILLRPISVVNPRSVPSLVNRNGG